MAVCLLAYEVADLCLGKPPLKALSLSSTVGDGLSALKISDDNYISVWSCDHSKNAAGDDGGCRCVGKVCMVDVICFLSRDENLSSPSSALKSPLSVLLPKIPGLVCHVERSSSLIEAIDLILQGAQNLVVPIKSKRKPNKSTNSSSTAHNGREYCWLTQEDIIRFLLSSIGLFQPIPSLSIENLGIISTELLAVNYDSMASSATGAISRSLAEQTSVAVVDEEGTLIGEISPFTLACCDETVAAAIATLSAGDLMAYIDCGGPPEEIARVVTARLKDRNLETMLEEFSIASLSTTPSNSSSSLSSSDDESLPSPTTVMTRSSRYSRCGSYSARMVRRSEAIVCHPWSSLVAVMIQAIAHRVNYVWVIEDDSCLVGIVKFIDMLDVFREHLQSMI